MAKRYFDPVEEVQKLYPTARYYYILGPRSCGKTYPIISQAIKDNLDGNGVFVYVRRLKDCISTADMNDLVGVHNEWVAQYTDGEYNRIAYWQSRFYLERWITHDDGTQTKEYKNPIPIGAVCDINTATNKKGPDFGKDKGGITHIILDEALEPGGKYLTNEWTRFLNVVSTYVRDRWEKDTKIWFLANPVSKWSNPYFTNLGIKTKLLENPGITEIQYPDEKGKPVMSTVFCYIAANTDKDGNVIEIDEDRTKVYNKFFAFTNSKGVTSSITHGYWEMEDAAHLPERYLNDSEIKRTIYFKQTEDDFFACDIMKYFKSNQMFLYFRECDEIPEDSYYFTVLPELEKKAIIGFDTNNRLYKVFYQLWKTNKLFYESNEIADAWHGWVNSASKYIP